jgi:hypothetical protein
MDSSRVNRLNVSWSPRITVAAVADCGSAFDRICHKPLKIHDNCSGGYVGNSCRDRESGFLAPMT